MKRYQITLDGRTFDVQVLSDPCQDQVDVKVDGETFTVQVKGVLPDTQETEAAEPRATTPTPAASLHPVPEPSPAAETGKPSGTLSGKMVVAPLPGVIKLIAVRSGQYVSFGDTLLVIEAMKMDNIIRAAREGIVETIHTAEGHQVAHGEPLLEYQEQTPA
jgi:biotin carboxyl carrier protein